ncbi:unnamed protein product [Ectocarpus sp. 6 AP-2014]
MHRSRVGMDAQKPGLARELHKAKFRAHHEKRLEEISRRPPGTGTLDNMRPYTTHLMHLKTRPKKMAILASRDAQVERANRDLLRQMTRIFTTPSALLPVHDSADGGSRGEGLGRCLSINVLCRKRELERIAMENKTWVKHMEKVSPSYNAAAWERDWLERKRIIERLRTVRYERAKATPEEFSRRGVTHLRKQVQRTRGQAFEAGYSPVPRLFGSARSKNRGHSGKSSNGGGRSVGPHRNRQTTKRKCFSSSSRSNRGKRTLHGHGRDARGGVLVRSGSERRARAGSKHEQKLVKRAASESSMVSSGDIGREEKTSSHCPPPLEDRDNGQDGNHLPISVSVRAATRGAEAEASGGIQEHHEKTAAAAAVTSEGGGIGDGGCDGGDNGRGGSQSDYSEFAGGQGDEEEQYSEFDEEQQEERREEKEEQEQDGQYSEFGDGSSTREAVVQLAEAERRSSEVEDVRQEQRLGDGLENEGEKQDTRGGSAGEAKAGLDENDCSRGQTEDPNGSTETRCSPELQLESAPVELENRLEQNDTSVAETASGAKRIEPERIEGPEQQQQEQQQNGLSVTKAQEGEVETKCDGRDGGRGSMRTGEDSELSADNGYRSESFDGDGYTTDSGVSGPVPEAPSTTQKAGMSPAGSVEPPNTATASSASTDLRSAATPEGDNSDDSCSSPPPLGTSPLLVEDRSQPGGNPTIPLDPPQPQEDPPSLLVSPQPMSVASSCLDISPETLQDPPGLDDPPPLPANSSSPSSPSSLPEDSGGDNSFADVGVVDLQPDIPLSNSDIQCEPGAHDHVGAAIPDADTDAGLVVLARGDNLPGVHSASDCSNTTNIEDSAPTNLAGASRTLAFSEECASADAAANKGLSGGASTAEGVSSSGVNGDGIESPVCGTTVTPAAANEHYEERNELVGTGGWSMVPEVLPPSSYMEQVSLVESSENIMENTSQEASMNDNSATTGPLAQEGGLQQPTTANGLQAQDSSQRVGEDSFESNVTLKSMHDSNENSDPATTATVVSGDEEDSRYAAAGINVEESDKGNEQSVGEHGNETNEGEPEAVREPAAEAKEPSGNGTTDIDPMDDGVNSPEEAATGFDAAAFGIAVRHAAVKEVQEFVIATDEAIASGAGSGESVSPTSDSADGAVHEASTGRESAANEATVGPVSSGRTNEHDGPDHSVSVGHDEPSTVGREMEVVSLDDDTALGPNENKTGEPVEIPEAIGGESEGHQGISADGADGNSVYDEVFEEMSSSTEQAAEAVSGLDGCATTSTAETGNVVASLFSPGKEDPAGASGGGDAGEPPLAPIDRVGESTRLSQNDSRGG